MAHRDLDCDTCNGEGQVEEGPIPDPGHPTDPAWRMIPCPDCGLQYDETDAAELKMDCEREG